MKIDFGYQFRKMNGDIIPERPNETDPKDKNKVTKKYPPFTLKKLCVSVLLNAATEEIICPRCKNVLKKPPDLAGDKKAKRFMLATKIHNGDGLVDISDDDVKLLKDLVAKDYPVLTVGQAWQILDPHEAEDNKRKS
jgi:hypothetical protein